MNRYEVRERARVAREGSRRSLACATALLQSSKDRLRRSREVLAASPAVLRPASAAAHAESPPANAEELRARFEAARGRVSRAIAHLNDATRALQTCVERHPDRAESAVAAERRTVRLFVGGGGEVYRVRCSPYEADAADRLRHEVMAAIVFETIEGDWIGSVPVPSSCTLDTLSERQLGAFLAFAR